MSIFNWDDGRDPKRTLGIRDRQILYRNAKGRCENPGCSKKIDFDEMEVGHKNAWSKGGRTTLKNSFCLCHRCNKLQGTDSWAVFLTKQKIVDPKIKIKESLKTLNVKQLKYLAEKHNIKVKGKIEEAFFSTTKKAPTKGQYINKLSGIVTEKEISSVPKEAPKTVRRKKLRRHKAVSLTYR